MMYSKRIRKANTKYDQAEFKINATLLPKPSKPAKKQPTARIHSVQPVTPVPTLQTQHNPESDEQLSSSNFPLEASETIAVSSQSKFTTSQAGAPHLIGEWHKTSTPQNKKVTPQQQSQAHSFSGRWTKKEHILFEEALSRFGKDWRKIEDFIGTRTCSQIRSHAQKYFQKIQKKQSNNNNQSVSNQNFDSYNNDSFNSQPKDSTSLLLHKRPAPTTVTTDEDQQQIYSHKQSFKRLATGENNKSTFSSHKLLDPLDVQKKPYLNENQFLMANCDRLREQQQKPVQNLINHQNNQQVNNHANQQNNSHDLKNENELEDFVAVQLYEQLKNFRFKRNRQSEQYLCKDLSTTELCLGLDQFYKNFNQLAQASYLSDNVDLGHQFHQEAQLTKLMLELLVLNQTSTRSNSGTEQNLVAI